MVDRVVAHMEASQDEKSQKKWIGQQEAMDLLGIKSTTALQKLRDECKIRYPDYNHIEVYSERERKAQLF